MNEKSHSCYGQQHQDRKRVDQERKGYRKAAERNPVEQVRHDPAGGNGKEMKENNDRTNEGKQYRAGTHDRCDFLRNMIKP